jgi:hypothetical protein
MMESASEGKHIKKHERERKTVDDGTNGTKASSPVCNIQEVAVRF